MEVSEEVLVSRCQAVRESHSGGAQPSRQGRRSGSTSEREDWDVTRRLRHWLAVPSRRHTLHARRTPHVGRRTSDVGRRTSARGRRSNARPAGSRPTRLLASVSRPLEGVCDDAPTHQQTEAQANRKLTIESCLRHACPKLTF